MKHISVVTGTYNRLDTLQRLHHSLRATIRVPFEHIVVDNGSIDGTEAWCVTTELVTLIQLGTPRGAIEAFTTGAYAATGKYVLLASDDCWFDGDSIMRALAYLETHDDAGCVAFTSWKATAPRGDQMQHKATLPDGTQGRIPYPQLSLHRKWLGDACDWWGATKVMQEAFTYGGDNHLGAQIVQRGYRVAVVEGCTVEEDTLQDTPRALNAERHPRDAAIFRAAYPNGPTVAPAPTVSNPDKEQLRVLFLNDPQHNKRGMYMALAQHGWVWEVSTKELPDIIARTAAVWQPHLIVSQIHRHEVLNADAIAAIRHAAPRALAVNFNWDYRPPTTHMQPAQFKLHQQFDVCAFVAIEIVNTLSANGINAVYWPQAFEPYEGQRGKKHDVVFLGNAYSPARRDLCAMLRDTEHDVGLYGRMSEAYNPDGFTHYDFQASANLYKAAKLAISTNEFAATGYTSNRFYEIAAQGGAIILHQTTPRFDELTGFEAGVHYVPWADLEELRGLMDYWLQPAQDKTRRAMAKAAQELALKDHSFDARVMQMFALLRVLQAERGHHAVTA